MSELVIDNMLNTTYYICRRDSYGSMLREPYSSPMGDGIFELRTKQGSNITRVFYFFFVGLLNERLGNRHKLFILKKL